MKDTLPRMVLLQCQRFNDRVVMRHKQGGRYHDISWDQLAEKIKTYARAPMTLELKNGQQAAIMSPKATKQSCTSSTTRTAASSSPTQPALPLDSSTRLSNSPLWQKLFTSRASLNIRASSPGQILLPGRRGPNRKKLGKKSGHLQTVKRLRPWGRLHQPVSCAAKPSTNAATLIENSYLPSDAGIHDTKFCIIEMNKGHSFNFMWKARKTVAHGYLQLCRDGVSSAINFISCMNVGSLEGSLADHRQIMEIEQALAGLVKLMKALRFYPKGHPSLQTAIAECMTAFRPMLSRPDNQAIQASQAGFSLGAMKIGEKNPSLPDLARMLAERRVNQLIFLSDLPAAEILVLLEGLTTPADEIYSIGGLPAFLSNHKVSTIWLNESSLDGALQKRQQLAADIEQTGTEAIVGMLKTTPEKSDLAQRLAEIIKQLNSEQPDDSYRLQMDKLLQLAPVYFEQAGAAGVLNILPPLMIQGQQQARNHRQRDIATSALERLLTETIVALMLAQFKRTSLSREQYQQLHKFIIALGIRIAPQLLSLISKEEDGTVRKRLSTLLGRMGEPLLALLREMTTNSKWYVVRNAVTLLGDLRLAAGINILDGLTSHPDQRVRRTLIRSLAMIGGKESVAPLLRLSRDSAVALRRPAVKALGATKSIEAVRPLLKIAQSLDPFGRQTEIRIDAVAALGLLGKKEALSPLLALAKRPNPLRLQRLEQLRAEIILTLGKLGDKNLDMALNRWRKSRHAVVQRAAEISLATLMKKS